MASKPNKTTEKKTVILRVLVRLEESGAYEVLGYGTEGNEPVPVAELREKLDEEGYYETKYEEYLMEIEVPAYTGISPLPRFKLKADQ